MSTKPIQPSSPSLIATFKSLIEAQQSKGSKICGVAFKFILKEETHHKHTMSHSSSNCAGGAAASFDGKKIEIVHNMNTSSLNREAALAQSIDVLARKISEVLTRSAAFLPNFDLDLNLTLVTQPAEGGISTIKQSFTWEAETQESLVTKLLEVEDLATADKKICIKILNRSTSDVTDEEIGYLRAELILQCVAFKKAPLSPDEYCAISHFAEQTSWRPDVGLCSGISDGFNLFTLKKLKASAPISPIKDLMKEFTTSPEYKSALLLQTLNHFDLHKNFGAPATGLIVPRKPVRPDYLTWPQLQNYFARFYPEVTCVSAQLDQKTIKEKELLALDRQIIQKAAKLGVVVKDLENLEERTKIATLVKTGLLTGDLETIFSLYQDMEKRMSLLQEIGRLSFKTASDLVEEMDNIFSAHDEVALKISYFDKAREGGHVVSAIYSKITNTFIFFDSNEGCYEFVNKQNLFQHIVKSLSTYSSFNVSYMT